MFLAEVGVEADSLEGYLFPDTYRFANGLEAFSVRLYRPMLRFALEWRWLTAATKPLLASTKKAG